MKINKENLKKFKAGSPYSCRLREELIGELADYKNGFGSKIIEKLKPNTNIPEDILYNYKTVEDLPEDWRNVAYEIIKTKF